jgi:hypothetical protein
MHYVTVFDATDWRIFFRGLWIPLMFLVGAIAAGRAALQKGPIRPDLGPEANSFSRFIAWLMFPAMAVATLATGSGIIGSAILSRNALLAGNCRVVEGRVHDFRPLPHPKGIEHFEIGRHAFDYGPTQNWGFRASPAGSSPIHDGLQVRLCDDDGSILRLEIAR